MRLLLGGARSDNKDSDGKHAMDRAGMQVPGGKRHDTGDNERDRKEIEKHGPCVSLAMLYFQ